MSSTSPSTGASERNPGQPAAALSTEEQMRGFLMQMDGAVGSGHWKSATNFAFRALGVIGLGTPQELIEPTVETLDARVTGPSRALASRALCSLGIGQAHHSDQNHLTAFRFLELAARLDPSNASAAANLSDRAIAANEERVRYSTSTRGSPWVVIGIDQEIAREKLVAVEALQRSLAACWGLAPDAIDSETAQISRPSDPVERAHLCWCLGNLAKLRLQFANEEHDVARATGERRRYLERDRSLRIAEANALAALQGVGLSKHYDRLIPRVRKAAQDEQNPWEQQTKNVAQSFNVLGSVRELQMRHTDAIDFYFLATLVNPDLKFAADRLRHLQQRNPDYHVEDELDRKFGTVKKAQAPAVEPTWEELRATYEPADHEPIIQESVSIFDALPFEKDAEGHLEIAADGTPFPDEQQTYIGLLEIVRDVMTLEGSPAVYRSRVRAFIKSTSETVNTWWEAGTNPAGYVRLVGIRNLLQLVNTAVSGTDAKRVTELVQTTGEILSTVTQYPFDFSDQKVQSVEALVQRMIDFTRKHLRVGQESEG